MAKMKDKDKLIVGGVIALGTLALLMGMGGDKPAPEDPGEPGDPKPGPGSFVPGEIPEDPTPDPGSFVPGEIPEDPAPDPNVFTPAGPDVDDPVLIVNKYFADGTRTGTLYLIDKGDDPTSVAKRALGVSEGHPAILPYILAMTTSMFNFALYDVIWTPVEGSTSSASQKGTCGTRGRPGRTTRRYTLKAYDDKGQLQRWCIGDAFLPHHRNILGMLRSGQGVERSTNNYGDPYASRGYYGLIWLPKVTKISSSKPYIEVPDLEPPADLQSLAPEIFG